MLALDVGLGHGSLATELLELLVDGVALRDHIQLDDVSLDPHLLESGFGVTAVRAVGLGEDHNCIVVDHLLDATSTIRLLLLRRLHIVPVPQQSVVAVAHRILLQVPLVVSLSLEVRVSIVNGGAHSGSFVAAYLTVLDESVYFRLDILGSLLLLSRMREDHRSVLSASVVSLPVHGGRVVESVEELDQLVVSHL